MNLTAPGVIVHGGPIALPEGIVDGQAVLVRNGRIVAVRRADHPALRRALTSGASHVHNLAGSLLAPGFIDLHVHGAHGASFETVDDAGPALAGLAARGVTSVMASLGSARFDEMVGNVEAWSARRRRPDEAKVLGVHLEGPFIAVDQRGAHDPRHLRTLDTRSIDRITDLAGAVAMVTVAPELAHAATATRSWTGAGIVVAAGHSSAGAADLHPCVDAGLSHITHLWSAMGATVRVGPYRSPGLLEEALSSSSLTCEVIADGRHLPPPLLEIARRCVGDRLIAVSDGTTGIGLPEGTRYEISGVSAVVDDGVGKVVGRDVFAGSTTDLTAMVKRLHRGLGWPLADVLSMVTSRPAEIAGVSDTIGSIRPGLKADLVVLDQDCRPERVIVEGRWLTG